MMRLSAEPVINRSFILAIVLILSGLVPLSFVILDRPVAIFVHENLLALRYFFAALTHLADGAVILAGWAVVCVLVCRYQQMAVNTRLMAGLRAAAGMMVTALCIKCLKYAAGRTWPETWVGQNPSFFDGGIYGFFPFHGGAGWSSFPSGHTAVIVSGAATLWVLVPEWRFLCVSVAVAVGLGLLGANYHWLSDIIAGGAIAAMIGVCAARSAISSPAV